MEDLNESRHKEISNKLFKMSEALMIECEYKDDYIIQSTGNFIMLLSGIMGNEDDMRTVSDLLAMFSAKKVLDSQMMDDSIIPDIDDLGEMLKKMRDRLENEEDED